MTAQEDDREMLAWVLSAAQLGGGFVAAFAIAALLAESDDYSIIRPALLVMRKKYPDHDRLDKTCPRCGHLHEGEKECGTFIGGGRICRCEMEVSA